MPTANTPAGAAAATAAEPGAERLNTRAAGVVGLAVLCSRVLGLAREQIFAALFGGGRVMDAFTIAFRIPNLLRDLFAEGALSRPSSRCSAARRPFRIPPPPGGSRTRWRRSPRSH